MTVAGFEADLGESAHVSSSVKNVRRRWPNSALSYTKISLRQNARPAGAKDTYISNGIISIIESFPMRHSKLAPPDMLTLHCMVPHTLYAHVNGLTTHTD